MKNFNQGGGASRFGGGSRGASRFGGGNRSGGSRFGSDRGPVTMHKATCSDCGNACEVPFRPTGEKPIFCSDCFSAKRGGEAPRAPRGGSFGGDRAPRRDFSPSYNSAPRGDSSTSSLQASDVKKQLEFLGMKIDRLTKLVEGMASAPAPITAKKSAEVKEAIKEATSDKPVEAKTKTKTPAKKVVKKVEKKVAKKVVKKTAKK